MTSEEIKEIAKKERMILQKSEYHKKKKDQLRCKTDRKRLSDAIKKRRFIFFDHFQTDKVIFNNRHKFSTKDSRDMEKSNNRRHASDTGQKVFKELTRNFKGKIKRVTSKQK